MYEFKDGKVIDVGQVRDVSKIWDKAGQSMGVNQNRIGFTVSMKRGKAIDVFETYHFTDWGEAKKQIQQERLELINKIREVDPDFAD